MGRTVGCLPPSESLPEGTTKASPQKGGGADPAWVLWVLVIATAGRQPSGTPILYNVLGASWATLTKNSEESFSCLVLVLFACLFWFLRWSVALGGGIVSPDKNFHLEYMCVCIAL